MNAIEFEGVNKHYGAPKNWDPERDGKCHTLPTCVDASGNIVSVWEPTIEERARIAEGQNICLTCYTVQPPVALTVAPLYPLPHLITKGAPLKIEEADAIACDCGDENAVAHTRRRVCIVAIALMTTFIGAVVAETIVTQPALVAGLRAFFRAQ